MGRHYGMDWLRIGAFGLLILYHVGMAFVHWPWHVKTAQPLEWVAVPMLATNAWRLGLLFVVSGYASAAILEKDGSPARFAGTRSARLLVPLAFAVAVIVPPQPWVELVTQHGYARPFAAFWAGDYWRFGVLDGIVLPTWQHLWFVVYLWVYSMLLALALAVLPQRARAVLAAGAARLLAGPAILLVPAALLLAELWLSWPKPGDTHALVDDWGAHRVFLPLFLFGLLLRRAGPVWTAIRRWWRWGALLAAAGYCYIAWVELTWPGSARPPANVIAGFAAARAVHGWGAIVALIGIADAFWNRDHRWRATLAEAVFPFYIIHQTIIVVAMFWLLPLALAPAAEFAILVPVTAAGCWLFYLAGREIRWLRPLIGLRLNPPRRS